MFEMTTKHLEPDVDAWHEQEGRQRRSTRNKKVGALAIAATIAVAAVALALGGLGGQNAVTPADEPTTPGPSASPPPASFGPVDPWTLTVEGVTFSFRADRFWERHGAARLIPPIERAPASINKDIVGPQGAEAIIFWTSFPDSEHAVLCGHLLSPPVGSSAADLAAAVATAPGTELIRGPSDVTVGGHPAKHVVLAVREDIGCDPGFFYSWQDERGGAVWGETNEGDTIRVWVIDVEGTLLFMEAETTEQATPDLERQIQQIVESIRFD
ncbi:MAG: hypothetical protein ACRDJ5_08545 [Actinomycetota bacterium]